MELIGKLFKKLPEITGESARGLWVKMDFVIETQDQFPKQICFSLWGEDKVAVVRNMQLGAEMKVYFSPESKEYKERWYTELKCFKIDVLGTVNQTQQQVTQPQQANEAPIADDSVGSFGSEPDEDEGQLPF